MKPVLALLAVTLVLGSGRIAYANEYVYVANFRSDTISILSPSGEAVLGTMPLATAVESTPVEQVPGDNPTGAVVGLAIGGPVAIAAATSGSVAYVAQTGSPGALSLVDTTDRRVLATIRLGNEPFALALGPDGKRVYVANFASATLSVVDVPARKVSGTIPVGPGPSGVVVSDDGAWAYVTNFPAGTVSVVDLGAGKIAETLSVGKGPIGVALAGTTLLVANSGSNTVSVIDTRTKQTTSGISVGNVPVMVVVGPDGKRAYVSNQREGSVSMVDLTAGKVTNTIPVGHEPFGLALTANGDLLEVANRSSDSVSVVDTRTDRVIRNIGVGSAPFGIAVGGRPSGGCHCAIQPGPARPVWVEVFLAFTLPLVALRTLGARRSKREKRKEIGTAVNDRLQATSRKSVSAVANRQ